MNEKGFEIEANTLYPLLRRLEKQGLLESFWDTDGTKPRRYYKLSKIGEGVYSKLCAAWNDIDRSVNHLIDEEE
jgi:DNA-binding PadR family transcriptional regulator